MRDRNTARLARSALLIAAALVCACGGDDDDDGDGGGGAAPQTYTCFASVEPVTFDYVVSGDQLEVSGAGTTETWDRLEDGDPERPVYGIWRVDEEATPGVGVFTVDLLVEPGQVSAMVDCDFGSVSASARAVSAAEISDSMIVILESDEDIEVVTR